MTIRSDIDLNFRKLSDGSIAIKTGVDAIKQSVEFILFTQPGERPYDPEFGSTIPTFLEGSANRLNSLIIKDIIFTKLKNYLSDQIILFKSDISVEPNYDENTYDISIYYRENKIQTPQEINFNISVER